MNSYRRTIFAILLSLPVASGIASCSVSPTGPDEIKTWLRYFGGSDADWANAVIPVADGGYIIAGMTVLANAPVTSMKQAYLGKLDADGDSVWARTFGGLIGTATQVTSVIPASDGGYLAVGTAAGPSGGGFEVYIFKVSERGDSLWTRVYGGTNQDLGQSVVATSDGGYLVAGYSGYDAYFIKTDAEGHQLWQTLYETPRLEVINSVATTPDGGFVAVGMVLPDPYNDSTTYDICIVKIDQGGHVNWTKSYGSTYYDVGYDVVSTFDGNILIVGTAQSLGPYDRDVLLIKTDSLGNKLWSRTFGGREDDEGHGLVAATDGGYLLVGYTKSFGTGGSDVYLLKTDSSGNEQWSRAFGGARDDFGLSVAWAADGGLVVAGETESFGSGRSDILLIKTDASGGIQPAE